MLHWNPQCYPSQDFWFLGAVQMGHLNVKHSNSAVYWHWANGALRGCYSVSRIGFGFPDTYALSGQSQSKPDYFSTRSIAIKPQPCHCNCTPNGLGFRQNHQASWQSTFEATDYTTMPKALRHRSSASYTDAQLMQEAYAIDIVLMAKTMRLVSLAWPINPKHGALGSQAIWQSL